MALQGTLDSFSLPDVLRLLADTGKTGRLHVEGDRGQGNVWIDDGGVVAAGADGASDDAPTDEVIFEMLRFKSGSFAFAADEPSPNGGEPVDLEGVLRRAGELLDEWRELEAVVPSLDHRVAIAPELTVDKVTIDASRWTTLVAVAGGVSVRELGSALDKNEMAILRTVSDLVELGIVAVQEPSKGQPSRRGRVGQPTSRRIRTDRASTEERRPEPQAEPHPVGANGRNGNGSNGNEDPIASRARRSVRDRTPAELPSGDRPERADRPQLSQRPIGTSRSGVQRSSRQVGGHTGAHGAAAPAMPPSSPFSSGSVMPPQQGMPDPVGGGQGLSGLPAFNNNETQPLMAPSLDAGPLGPSPLAPPVQQDTGQVPVVAASSLPPDLSWAAEDDEAPLGAPSSPPSPSMGIPPAPVGRTGSPLLSSGRSALGTEVPPPVADGDPAPHVVVMSPDARMAVEATVGPAGGGPGVVPAAGATPEEVQQRGTLLGFLSSVRH